MPANEPTTPLNVLTHVAGLFDRAHPVGRFGTHHWVLFLLIVGCGAILRLWNLGALGLHGDEDIMALAVRGVVEQGLPYLPSGMFYARAPLHTYLMALSVWIFGESEWALRLPSAMAGVLCCVLAFFMGRRFLEPAWNLAFVAVIAFLPAMLEISQTARMYVFFVAALMLYAVAVARWERDGSNVSLAGAGAAWLLAYVFHALAAFAAALLLFPGIVRGDWRRLAQGGAALVIAGGAHWVIKTIIGRQYPDDTSRLDLPQEDSLAPHEVLGSFDSGFSVTVVVAIAVIVVAALFLLARTLRAQSGSRLAALSLIGGIAAAAALHYYLAAVLLLAGVVGWFRSDQKRLGLLVTMLAAVAVVAVLQLYGLHASGAFPGRKLVGAVVGAPSIWPLLVFAEYSPTAMAVFAVGLAVALFAVARRQRVPEHFLYSTLTVWAPLFGIGLFQWHVPLRYTISALPFFLLCSIAVADYLLRAARERWVPLRSGRLAAAWPVAIAIAFIQPLFLAEMVADRERLFPDHRGAAEFVRSLGITDADVLIAEDSIVQTYYLGKVDYRLLSIQDAVKHGVLIDGQLVGQYTGTPIIGTGDALLEVLNRPQPGRIIIIGSGENFEDGRRYMRGNGLFEILESGRVETIFVGRDGRTRVWQATTPP